MKLDIKTDFTSLPKAGSVVRAGDAGVATAFDKALLPHDERHLRRKVLPLAGGGKLLVDLPEPVTVAAGDRLVLDDGRQVEIGAEPEELLEARARDAAHLGELAWHLGSRHRAAQIEAGRLLVLRDHAVEDMLKELGAAVRHVVEPFQPLRDAHSGHDHHHGHGHDHGHSHSHGHGEPDAYGRLPGDPHYGHNHA